MENQSQNTSVPLNGSRGNEATAAFDVARPTVATSVSDPNPLAPSASLGSSQPTTQVSAATARPRPPRGRVKRWMWVSALVGTLLIGGIVSFIVWQNKAAEQAALSPTNNATERFDTISLSISDLSKAASLVVDAGKTLSINGQLKVNNGVIITPTAQPTAAVSGQLYYDQGTNLLNYYNGSGFVSLATNPQTVTSLGGASGILTLGGGLSIAGNQLTNSGILSITTASNNLVATDDGNGNITLTDTTIGGTGNVLAQGGTPGRIAMFDDTTSITDSLLSQSGSVVTVAGSLTLQDSGAITTLSLAHSGSGVVGEIFNDGNLHISGGTNNVWIDAGGTGTIFLNSANGNPVAINQTTIPAYPLEVNGDINISDNGGSYRIDGTVICTISGCLSSGGSGVDSVNGLSGTLNVANATGLGTTITIDDASTSQKGIAQFNATNFNVVGGNVNTVQNIHTGATPTFAGINTNSITPSGALTVGSTTQSTTLQGSNTTITATNGANTVSLTFVAPTANVTYRLQTAAAGTYDVCTTAGNCVGTGGGVSTPGGTTNALAKFTGTQTIGDSIISDDGTLVTVSGDLTVTGTVTLTTPLAVTQGGTGATTASGARTSLGAAASGANSDITSLSGLTTALSVIQGGTGATSLTANGVLLGNGASAVSSLAAGGAGLCLVSTAGAPTWQSCPGSGGVTSVNGLTGTLTIANASGAGSTITINDASTSQKGIAQFNSTNFSVASGVVNTIQNIDSGATPTFAGINTNSITPSAALTVGATAQDLTLQGSNTTITETNGASTVSLTFVAPTANVTYRLQTAAAGTYDVCTTAGNCTGVGGGVSTPGGTTNALAKFTGSQTIGDSIISDDGSVVTINGDLTVTGTVTLTTPLAVTEGGTGSTTASGARTNLGAAASGANSDITSLSGLTTALSVVQGGTGATTFTTNGVLIGNGTSAISAVAAGGAGQCLVSTAGAPTWQSCPGAGGVSSVNGLTGALTIANASGAGSTITLDDASTSQKGIAQFNSTNFSVTSGTVNTIQDINTTAAPTFGQMTLTSSQASAAMLTVNNTNVGATGNLVDLQINGSSRFAVSPAGALTLSSTVNGQTISSSANFTGTLAVAGAASLNGGASVTGTLAANTITPSAALTVGATTQSFTLQGNASSTVTATNGANTTTLSFQTPTASVTYRLLTAAAGTYDICTTVGNCAGVGGGVTTPGGTTNTVAKFTASGVIGDSIITDDGTTVTIGGTLGVNTVTPTAGMTIGATTQNLTLQGAVTQITATSGGITNTLAFATPGTSNKTVTIPNASGTVAVSASGPLSLDSNGNISCPTCVTSGGGGGGVGAVDSLNGLTGALTLANSSGVGTTITIDDASTSQKGIAQFNSTNFTASSGTINTIQDIHTAAAPTFGQLTISSSQATAAMLTVNNTNASGTGNLLDLQLNGSSRLSVTPAGNLSVTGTINGQTISSTASFTGSLAVTGAANLNGGATVTGNLTQSGGTFSATSTGSATLAGTGVSIDAGSGAYSLQGASTSTIAATSGSFTTTLGFATPTANVTLNLPALSAGTYTLCTTSGNCLGGSGGANTALSNLASVAINTSLLPGSAGAINLGSGTLPFGDVYMAGSSGTPGTNNFRITGASTSGTRTVTLPDASGTVCLQSSSSCGFVTGTSADFIQNQNASAQTTANYWISGSGRADTSILSPALDRATAGTLTLGATTATALTVGRSGVTTTVNGSLAFSGAAFSFTSSSTSSATVTGSLNLSATAASTWQTTSGNLTIRAAGTNSELTLENTSSGGSINIGAATNNVRTITIGTGTGGSQTQTVTLGSVGGSSITTIQAGTGNINLNSGGTIELQDNTNVTGNVVTTGDLAVNGGDITSSGALNITPGGTLTVGATGQALILQGNASSTLAATNSGSTTALIFQTPTANVNYRLVTATAGTYDICTTANNCSGSGTLQTAYNNSTNPEIVLDSTRGALTVRDASTPIGANLLEVQNNGGTSTYFAVSANDVQIRPGSSGTSTLNVKSAAGDNIFTVDTTNGRVGINLGANNTPTLANPGLEIQGALRLTGTNSDYGDDFTTPQGSTVRTKIHVPLFDPGSFNQVVALGVPSGAQATARVLGLYDARASAHQPTVGVLSPDESDIFGLSWDGSNSIGYLKTLGGSMAIRSNTTDIATFATNGITTKTSTNSATGFVVQNASDVAQLTVDTSNSRLYVGPTAGDTTGTLLVLGNKTNSGDPTGVAGAMYYNANRGKMRCYEDGSWMDCNRESRTNFYAETDLTSGNASDLPYVIYGNLTEITAVAGHPGIVRFDTGGSSSGLSAAGLDNTTDSTIVLGNGGVWRVESVLRIPTNLSNGTQRFTVYSGFNDGPGTALANDACVLQYSDNINGGEWQGACRSGGGATTTCDTNIAVVADTWYRLTVTVNAAGTSVDFKINGTSACQVAASIPTAATNVNVGIVKSVGTTARSVDIDYVETWGEVTR